MRISIVGLGLIGGSMALDLRAAGFATELLGVESDQDHSKQALSSNLVDAVLPLDRALAESDLMILSVPVQQITKLLPDLLRQVGSQVIMDVGSTKRLTAEIVQNHPSRDRYVATHPMSGTEFSGPSAAIRNLFREKVTIFCDVELSNPDALEVTRDLYQCLGMRIIEMNSKEHDLHAAYVSHISHISSFALATTVLEKEKDAENIFNLASGGFDSTVRLANSSAKMWAPIFTQNAKNVINVLDKYISELHRFRDAIEKQDADELNHIILQANRIRKILKINNPHHGEDYL